MGISEDVVRALGRGSEMIRARVAGIDGDARLLVAGTGERAGSEWHCDVLATAPQPLVYELGDEVLVLLGPAGASDGIVLGRVGRAATVEESAPAGTAGSQHEKRVVIEADEELVLRVGESSIRISADGKVVIRGHHVLSRAKGTNRIKGGSVAIN